MNDRNSQDRGDLPHIRPEFRAGGSFESHTPVSERRRPFGPCNVGEQLLRRVPSRECVSEERDAGYARSLSAPGDSAGPGAMGTSRRCALLPSSQELSQVRLIPILYLSFITHCAQIRIVRRP
jgi:hypothetical protein